MEIGKTYTNGGMRLLYLENYEGNAIFYRLNDNSYVYMRIENIYKKEENEISWVMGHYCISMDGVIKSIDRSSEHDIF